MSSLNEIENPELREYCEDYVKRVIIAIPKLEFVSIVLALDEEHDREHHIFSFEAKGEIDLTAEQIEVLTEDDDSQPRNTYRVWFGDVTVYSTRYW